jgi:hypothetical protein
MTVTGTGRERLQRALLAAFPSKSSLAQMIDYKFNLNLEEIAGGDDLSAIVHNLIRWMQARGRLEDLMIKAREANPGNPELDAVVGELLNAILFAPDPPRTEAPAPDSAPVPAAARRSSKATLRKAMAQAFDSRELELLAADVQDALQEHGLDQTVSLAAAGAENVSLETQVLRLIEFLDRRRQLDFLVEAVRRARPGLLP